MNNSAHDKSRQMAREFKIGITVLAVLFCVFMGVAYRHYHISFSDSTSNFPAQTTQVEPANTAPPTGPNDHSQRPSPVALKQETAAFEPPPYDESSRSSSFQPPSSVLPPPTELSVESKPRKVAVEDRNSSGGSFQPLPSPEDNDDDETPDLAAPNNSGGNLHPPASKDPLKLPEDAAPAAIDLSPPSRTERATFQQEPDQVESVQRTQFRAEERNEDSTIPAVGADPAVPLNLAIESSPKPIGLSSRVETIREGDSFWLISQRAYGNGNYFRALYEHNRRRFPEPDRLPVGAPVEIPSVEMLRQRFPDFCPKAGNAMTPPAEKQPSNSGRVYTVVGGESLFDVARFQLGQGSRYVEIIKLNREVLKGNADPLPAGLRLRLPTR